MLTANCSHDYLRQTKLVALEFVDLKQRTGAAAEFQRSRFDLFAQAFVTMCMLISLVWLDVRESVSPTTE